MLGGHAADMKEEQEKKVTEPRPAPAHIYDNFRGIPAHTPGFNRPPRPQACAANMHLLLLLG